MEGRLFLCATPIGNLSDITQRVLDTLSEVDIIAAEDTRNSIKLLNHFNIKTPMTSYHEFNKIEKAHELIEKMKSGADIALISDAGMPGISDPGQELVLMCHEAGIKVTAVPGATASLTALTISGFQTRSFCFEGFLPTDKKEKAHVLERISREERTIIIYEAPHRLKKTLATLKAAIDIDREIAFCRELTKKHEECLHMTLGEAIGYYEENVPRGEFVLIIKGIDYKEQQKEEQQDWEKLSITEHMNIYLEQGIEKKEAMKMVAKDRGKGKSDIYKKYLEENENSPQKSGIFPYI